MQQFFYCSHALADSKQCIRISKKMLELVLFNEYNDINLYSVSYGFLSQLLKIFKSD